MVCSNGLVYYIVGIATLASGMTIFWVGYIDHFAGGLHLVTGLSVLMLVYLFHLFIVVTYCELVILSPGQRRRNRCPLTGKLFQLACNHDDVAICNVRHTGGHYFSKD